MPPQEELDGSLQGGCPSAEDDMLQLSVIRTEGGGAGTGRLKANITMEKTVREGLVTLTDKIRSF